MKQATCHYCGRPATWHAAWQTPTMPAMAFAYACDEHKFEGMTPLDEPLGPILEHLPARRRETCASDLSSVCAVSA
jgi:hypothetical protein